MLLIIGVFLRKQVSLELTITSRKPAMRLPPGVVSG